ncbi:MAG: 2-C-methyl-D-erythritol 2,4-cyclodiphosphate synthase [Gammaproteobacteria bacterium]|nr:2-C-methyl-D-erythritol 2,4-cyclodiphosphate synthase [Gammaproteobacteria bacterium]
MRIGHGYDVHAFAENRKLILGGVEIAHDRGLAGHSDADVLLHAICDALLGAAAMGDIGQHFPDTASEYENIDSRILLRHVVNLLREKSFVVSNLDCTIIAQRPKLASFIQQMRDNICEDLGVSRDAVNVKATTTEKLGFTGREEGIAAEAVVLLQESRASSE